MPARSAGQLTGCRGMIRPEGFLQSGLEYLVAFRADVFYIHINLHTDVIFRLGKFGQKAYRLDVPRDTIMNVNSMCELTNQSASNRRNLLCFLQ